MVNARHPSPSEAIVDSQSVKSAAMISEAVGYDAGKQVKGRKRFVTVDTLGLVLRVWVAAEACRGARRRQTSPQEGETDGQHGDPFAHHLGRWGL